MLKEATSPQPGFPNSWSSLSSFPLREKFNRKRKKRNNCFEWVGVGQRYVYFYITFLGEYVGKKRDIFEFLLESRWLSASNLKFLVLLNLSLRRSQMFSKLRRTSSIWCLYLTTPSLSPLRTGVLVKAPVTKEVSGSCVMFNTQSCVLVHQNWVHHHVLVHEASWHLDQENVIDDRTPRGPQAAQRY